jgi:hypothetical protein
VRWTRFVRWRLRRFAFVVAIIGVAIFDVFGPWDSHPTTSISNSVPRRFMGDAPLRHAVTAAYARREVLPCAGGLQRFATEGLGASSEWRR